MYSFKPSLLSREEERRMASIFILGVVAGDAASFQELELVVPVSRGISGCDKLLARSCATTPRAAFLKLREFRNKAKRALSLWSSRVSELDPWSCNEPGLVVVVVVPVPEEEKPTSKTINKPATNPKLDPRRQWRQT
jgi:hypothetical protein